ncbi:hypothetical protein diail_9709 [Diaporthe ilicicola]|nr:hypothetical protein diail_9709 [Diaporthe ilicicola]
MRAISLALTTASALLSVSEAASLEQWKSRSIYQVLVDRYARTDGSTTAACDELYLFCNGTWTGLINGLDYIQDMGFTAIQISPVVKNIEDDTAVGEAYHGYYSQDLYAINEHFGTADELKSLADELHSRDMYLLVDVVVNNMAQKFNNTIPPPVDYSVFEPFDNQDYFHPYCNVTEWTNATNYQDCWLYPYGVALADLKTEDTKVADMFGSWIKELVSNYSIDGLRIDAAKHVNPDFLPTFVSSSGVFALGEVLTGETADFCPYQTQGYLPGMPNYLEYYPIIDAFNDGSMTAIDVMRQSARDACNDTLALGSFVENHDMPRFAHYNADMAIAKNAMAYIILNDGMPLVYQGQEQHYSGGETPANREPVWLSGFNKSAELYITAQKLNKARNTLIGLTNTSDTTYVDSKAQTLMTNDNHLCQVKGPEGYQIVSCIVNHSSSGPSYSLSIGGFTAGDQVVELLSCGTGTADETGNVTMYMNRGEPKAYVLQSLLQQMPGVCNTTEDAETASKDGAAVGLKSSLAVVLTAAFASGMMLL